MRAICAITFQCVVSVPTSLIDAGAGLLPRDSQLVQAALSKQYSPQFLRRASELENLPEEYDAEVDDDTSEDSSIEDVASGSLGSDRGYAASLFQITIPSDVVLPTGDTFLPRRLSAEQENGGPTSDLENLAEEKATAAADAAAEGDLAKGAQQADSVPIDMDDQEVGSQVDQALNDAYERADQKAAEPEKIGKVQQSFKNSGPVVDVPPSAATPATMVLKSGGAHIAPELPQKLTEAIPSTQPTLQPSPKLPAVNVSVGSAPPTAVSVDAELPSPSDDDSGAEEPRQRSSSALEAENASEMIRAQVTSEINLA